MKHRIKNYLLIFALAALSFGAYTQDAPTEFSLDEAQQFAMKNSYVLKNTDMDITKAQKKVWETITMGLPQVSASMDYTKNITAAKTPFPVAIIPKDFWPMLGIPDDTPPEGTYPISFMPKFNSNYGFMVNQLIFDGSYIVGVGSSQVYLNLAKQAHEKTSIDIRDAVAQAYYLVLIGKENKKVMEENLKNIQLLYDETKAYYENGFREEQDVDQMKLLLQNAKNEILKANREIKIAKVVLKYTMGYPVGDGIALSGELKKILNPLVENKPANGFNHLNHIDYKLSETNLMVSNKLLKLEKAAFLPRLSMFYNWNKTAYGEHGNLFRSSTSWLPSSMLGFNLSIPVFSSGQRISRVNQAKIEVAKAVNQKILASQTLQKDYLTAKANLESSLEKYDNDVENRQLAQKIKDKAKIKFENGLISSTELSQIESQYIQTYGAYIGSALQLLQADLSLKKAQGKL